MPLDEATRRLAFLLQRDLRRLVERERARVERGEQVGYDSVSRMATWETRRGDVIGRWYGEVIATYVPKDRILRWSWAGRSSIATASHSEIVAQEGETRGIAQLTMSVVGELDEEEASMLARLGVLVARGEGMQLRRTDAEIQFIGLFDSPRPREETPDPARYSVPPPAVSPTRGSSPPATPPHPTSSPPGAPYRSLPPIREIYEPRSEIYAAQSRPKSSPPLDKKVREPSKAIFLPVATSVLSGLSRAVPGFKQALFVLTVDSETSGAVEKRRLVVVLAAVDAAGVLRAIDPSHDLLEAAARMVEADRDDGNGRWRKLSARITMKADGGATLNVDVL